MKRRGWIDSRSRHQYARRVSLKDEEAPKPHQFGSGRMTTPLNLEREAPTSWGWDRGVILSGLEPGPAPPRCIPRQARPKFTSLSHPPDAMHSFAAIQFAISSRVVRDLDFRRKRRRVELALVALA
jgi:hypothetical protein